MNLASRPVLLDLIARHDERFTPATRLQDLYERFIHKMLERGNDTLETKRRKFAVHLAWVIQNSASGSRPEKKVTRLAARYGTPEFEELVRSRSLLVREGNDYAFAHPSFREYLVAKRLVSLPRLKKCKLTNPTIEFLRDMRPPASKHAPPPLPPEHGKGEYTGMVRVPAGPFIFGQGDKPGDAEVRILEEAFWIDRYPVTNADYLAFLKNSDPKQHSKWIDHESSQISDKRILKDAKLADHPVVGVTWYGANEYAKSKGKQLPTEDQWEKAARGEDGREYPWGDGFDPDRCNVGNPGTTPVTKYPKGESL